MRASSDASSMPSMPGIEMSRNTTSNGPAWMQRSAVDRVPARSTTSPTSGASSSRRRSSLEGRRDVVDGEHPHRATSATGTAGSRATTPGWNRGTRSTTFVPGAAAVSTTSP